MGKGGLNPGTDSLVQDVCSMWSKRPISWPLGFHQSFLCCRHLRPNCSRRSWEQSLQPVGKEVLAGEIGEKQNKVGSSLQRQEIPGTLLPCYGESLPSNLGKSSTRGNLFEEDSKSGRLKKDESASLLHWGATTFGGYFVDVCKHLYAVCSIGLQVA